MAERRMMSKKIIDSDAFMDMSLSAQSLYFHLLMRADDDGFVGNPRKIMRMINANDDDYKLLVVKRFILQFPSGICVIKHWLIHNCIQKDRYAKSQYIEERNLIKIEENRAYTETNKKCIQNVSNLDTQLRLGKVSIDKVSKGEEIADAPPSIKKFIKPTLEEIEAYCIERGNKISPQKFIDHYESNGWKVGGKGAMKDWKASIRTWEGNSFESTGKGRKPANVLSTSEGSTLARVMKERSEKNK